MNVFTVMGRTRFKMVCSNIKERPLYYLRIPFITPYYRLRLQRILLQERLPHKKSEWKKILESIHTSEEDKDYGENEDEYSDGRSEHHQLRFFDSLRDERPLQLLHSSCDREADDKYFLHAMSGRSGWRECDLTVGKTSLSAEVSPLDERHKMSKYGE